MVENSDASPVQNATTMQSCRALTTLSTTVNVLLLAEPLTVTLSTSTKIV
jgi:hypothetical protein